ncbi:hypothetical protein D3C84_1258120 [compost metagenome]
MRQVGHDDDVINPSHVQNVFDVHQVLLRQQEDFPTVDVDVANLEVLQQFINALFKDVQRNESLVA